MSTLRPNIIIIPADDFGVGDIQRHYPDNNKNPDRLVDEGIGFTCAHSNSAVCSPTRYGLLTGRYNWRKASQLSYYDLSEEAHRPTKPGPLLDGGLVERGTSITGETQANDVHVVFSRFTLIEELWKYGIISILG